MTDPLGQYICCAALLFPRVFVSSTFVDEKQRLRYRWVTDEALRQTWPMQISNTRSRREESARGIQNLVVVGRTRRGGGPTRDAELLARCGGGGGDGQTALVPGLALLAAVSKEYWRDRRVCRVAAAHITLFSLSIKIAVVGEAPSSWSACVIELGKTS